ncbi:hypothetical protein Pmar_PMAR001253 [Perkinsus marinus ATCC 50983]|uniref:CCHC-type domain-containing protein n=1 Tax=Perkinsus marinus (strain ATCC 50983 / TXsc) TaxID=423536 RepID=C5KTA6_PERM5|nr:hypothetical protein Pmar_PMAR001253 [Perkinsus marinus ATCC 50983]EER12456.1 hypothetical protein Pmar_PMAR001253 [Perkinsus marinus ATCC 50983]|eukprot:XP_002780661.1 hypothetical protein Pmar_PMAR001253 [Perkinsus marinus ATCC 50983]
MVNGSGSGSGPGVVPGPEGGSSGSLNREDGFVDPAAEGERAARDEETARRHNETIKTTCQAVGSHKDSSSSEPCETSIPPVHAYGGLPTVMQVSAPMPEKYDGTGDLRLWFRRYENCGQAVGWSEGAMAAHLGGYLAGQFFECWEKNAKCGPYRQGKALLLDLFDRRVADQSLERFYATKWDRKSKIGLFVTKLFTTIDEYNATLPAAEQSSDKTRGRMVLDRLVANVSGGAKTALRNKKPSTVADMCRIVEDHTHSEDTQEKAKQPPQAAVAAEMILPDTMRAFTETMQAVIQEIKGLKTTFPGDAQGKGKGVRRLPPVKKCPICQGGHYVFHCPEKKYEKGCFLCGQNEHRVRSCPQLKNKVSAGNEEGGR